MSEENVNKNIAPVGTVPLVDGSEMIYRHDHILHWFNTEVYERTINLSPEDKDRYFQMVTDYGDILAKLLNDDNHVLYKHIQGKGWIDLESHAEKSNVVIDYDKPKQLLDEYDAWKARKQK
jgi:hypothetical protein